MVKGVITCEKKRHQTERQPHIKRKCQRNGEKEKKMFARHSNVYVCGWVLCVVGCVNWPNNNFTWFHWKESNRWNEGEMLATHQRLIYFTVDSKPTKKNRNHINRDRGTLTHSISKSLTPITHSFTHRLIHFQRNHNREVAH